MAERDGEKNTNPVIVTPNAAIQTSVQVSDFFLCKDCERLFSERGERWVLEHCWQADTSFPLRDSLRSAKPIHSGKTGSEIYSGATNPDVDVSKIAYFAASVFWRAAAHQFGPILREKPMRLTLGPYEEKLRTYLLDQSRFPSDAALLVHVSPEKHEQAVEFALLPYPRQRRSGFVRYGFALPGVMFQLCLGGQIPAAINACCIVHSPDKLIFLGPVDGWLNDAGALISRSTPKGGLHQ